MADHLPQEDERTTPSKATRFIRFALSQRIEHAVLLISFTTLAVTGLPQKFATSPSGELVLRLLGGIETARLIHRTAATVLLLESIYHLVAVLYRVVVRRVSWSMLPIPEDFKNLFQDFLFYLGQRKRKARYGRYSYAEKVEYLAVVWGTLIMAITGFMMWNPIATTRLLPGEIVPAAKAAHGGEALLAVLAIILWHFYHVHVRHFNKSMFTGELTREEMEQEHPAELAQIDSGRTREEASPEVIRRRERAFIPASVALSLLLGFGLFKFITFEETAIKTVPPAESAPVFVPQTPTPAPTLPPTPTPGEVIVAANSWDGGFEALFRNRCGTCHGVTSVGGLSLASYAQALKGGKSGPAIVPGDPQSSILVEVQSAGGHPGQLNEEELEQVIEWIEAGAPER